MTTTTRTDLVTLTIDGVQVTTKRGTSILDAASDTGIEVPHLCYIRGIRPYVGCRTCLVEIEGARGLELSCAEPVREGMVVFTSSPKVMDARRGAMEVVIADHPWKCLTCWRRERCDPMRTCQRDAEVDDRCIYCPKNRICELQEMVDYVDMRRDEHAWFSKPKTLPLLWGNPFIQFDPNKCIYCARCVRACNEIRHVHALELTFKGDEAMIATVGGGDLSCEFCGSCAYYCPTAAIMDRSRKYQGLPEVIVPSTCVQCGDGCGIEIDVKTTAGFLGRPRDIGGPYLNGINGIYEHPIGGRGEICVRGRYGYGMVQGPTRLARPVEQAGGELKEIDWGDALGRVAEGLARVKQQHGGQAIGFVTSSDLTNEESYLVQKLARAVLGTNEVDQPAMLFHRPTVEGLRAAFGTSAMTNSLQDLEEAKAIFVAGYDVGANNRISALKIKNAARYGGATLVVAHDREIDLLDYATLFLRYKPGSEVAVVNGLLRALLVEGLVDEAAMSAIPGYAELAAQLRGLQVAAIEAATGLSYQDITKAAYLLMGATAEQKRQRPIATVFGSGLTYGLASAPLVAACANLALLTGSLGRQGAGLAALVPHGNLVGSLDAGALPDFLPGYQPLADTGARAAAEAVWQGPVPAEPGRGLSGLLEAARRGEVKALVVFGDDLLKLTPDMAYVRECLSKVELLVAVDFELSETAKLAQIVLPGVTCVEKEGTFTSTERRVQRVRPGIAPQGEARPDWQILCDLGNRLALTLGSSVRFDYADPGEVFAELAALVPYYAGISHERLEQGFGIQWPCPDPAHPGTRTLFTDGDQGRFQPIGELPAAPAGDGSFQLLVDRTLFSDVRVQIDRNRMVWNPYPADAANLNPADVERLGLAEGDRVAVSTAHGRVELAAQANVEVPAGAVFVPISRFGSVQALLGHNGAAARVPAAKVEKL